MQGISTRLYMVTEEANICYRCVGNPQLVHVVRGKGQFGKCAGCGRRRRHGVPFSALGLMLRNVAEIYAKVQDNYSAVDDLIAVNRGYRPVLRRKAA